MTTDTNMWEFRLWMIRTFSSMVGIETLSRVTGISRGMIEEIISGKYLESIDSGHPFT